jgi:hypothetical protein
MNKANAEIRKDRGRRYGGQEDTLKNVRDACPKGAWRGAYVQATECMNRLRLMFDCVDEVDVSDFDNATEDLINYALYIKILGNQYYDKREEERGVGKVVEFKEIP